MPRRSTAQASQVSCLPGVETVQGSGFLHGPDKPLRLAGPMPLQPGHLVRRAHALLSQPRTCSSLRQRLSRLSNGMHCALSSFRWQVYSSTHFVTLIAGRTLTGTTWALALIILHQ